MRVPSWVTQGVTFVYQYLTTSIVNGSPQGSSSATETDQVTSVSGITVFGFGQVVANGQLLEAYNFSETEGQIPTVQFWVDPQDPVDSIVGPHGEPYSVLGTNTLVIGSKTWLVTNLQYSNPQTGTSFDLIYDTTTGLILEMTQNYPNQVIQFLGESVTPFPTATRSVEGDVTGSGRAAVVWDNPSTNGVGYWAMSGASSQWNYLGAGSSSFQVVGTGDILGNGNADILWENPTNATVGAWLMFGGHPVWQLIGQGSTTMKIAGVGDFYGNGTDDILWQNPTNNLIGEWQMSNGAPTWQLIGQGSTTMSIVGIGDFNGDGRSDVLWENPTNNLVGMWAMNGSQATWSLLGQGSTTMNIVGTGNFTGNGTADILWENPTNGTVGFWGMTGGHVTSWNVVSTASTAYQVAGVGDYYGNGTDDILWRNASTGDVGMWQMNNGQATWHDLGISSTAFNTVKT